MDQFDSVGLNLATKLARNDLNSPMTTNSGFSDYHGSPNMMNYYNPGLSSRHRSFSALSSFPGFNDAGSSGPDSFKEKQGQYTDPLNNFMMWRQPYVMPVDPSSTADDMMGYLEHSEAEAEDDDEDDDGEEDITDFNPPVSSDEYPVFPGDDDERNLFFNSVQQIHRPSLEIQASQASQLQYDYYHESPPYHYIDPSNLQLQEQLSQQSQSQSNQDHTDHPGPLDELNRLDRLGQLDALDQVDPLDIDSRQYDSHSAIDENDNTHAPAHDHENEYTHTSRLQSPNDTRRYADDIRTGQLGRLDRLDSYVSSKSSGSQSDFDASVDDDMDIDFTPPSPVSPADVDSDTTYSPEPTSHSKVSSRRTKKSTHGPHRCEMNLPGGGACNKSFTRPYDLVRHQETIHAQVRKTYRCEKCGRSSKTFSRMDALSRHMRIKHAKD